MKSNNIDKKYNLYFENSRGKKLLMCSNIKHDKVMSCIKNFCEERDFKIYYVQINKLPNGEEVYDVGSHSEFFIVKEIED